MKRFSWLLFALVLTACATIPDSSDVQLVPLRESQSDSGDVRVVVRPPSRNMSVDQIVTGFIAANARSEQSFAQAKQFLTWRAADTWRPRGVLIYDSTSTQISATNSNSVTVALTAYGVLRADSRLELFDSALPQTLQFHLTETADGWRIRDPEAQSLMSLTDLQRNFRAYQLWYLNDDYSKLVPDTVWLPTTNTETVTSLLRLLLAGSVQDGTGAQKSAFPEGSVLAQPAKQAIDGSWQISLSAQALQAVSSRRSAMLAQIAQTVVSHGGTVTVTAGGQILRQSNKSALSVNDFTSYQTSSTALSNPLFYVVNGKLFRGDGRNASLVSPATNVASMAISADGSRVAIATANSLELLNLLSGKVEHSAAMSVRDLAFDASGQLWAVKLRGGLAVFDTQFGVQPVPGLVPNQPVSSLAISPDGTRVALVVASPDGLRLRLQSIINTPSGVSLGSAQRLERTFAEVLDVDWMSVDSLAIVGRLGTEPSQVYSLSLTSLQPVLLGGVSNVNQVLAAPNLPVCAITGDSQLTCRSGAGWSEVTQATAAGYAG